MTATDILLVRHGQTDWNLSHRIQGSVDIPLNAIGVAQAAATRDAFAPETVDLLVSSHLERAAVTAMTINTPHGKPHRVDARLAERAHGRYEGWTVQEIIAEIGPGNEDEFFQRSPELEAWSDVAERVIAALVDVAQQAAGGTAVVVSHGGSIRAGIAAIRGVHHRTLPSLFNCSVTRLRYDGGWTVLDYNDNRHLPDALRT